MPRVSQAHLDARRQQILAAAWRCFARQGFHATSMQDVFAEADLSAGAVYRYFPSKAALVRATAESIVGVAEEAFRQVLAADPIPSPDQALRVVLESIAATAEADGVDRTALALHVWSEALREPEIRQMVGGVAERIIGRWMELVERWRDVGYVAAGADSGSAALTLYGAMIGFVVQRHFVGATAADYSTGLGSLLRPASVAEVAGGDA